MPDLAGALRACIEREGIYHMTLNPTQDGRWQAAVRRTREDGYRVEIADDPSEALIAALTNTRPGQSAETKRPKQETRNEPEEDLSDLI